MLDHPALEHAPLVERIARQLLSKLPASVELDDLRQDGLMALLESWQRFDPAAGASFATFASKRVRGAMLDQLRRDDPLTRRARSDGKQLDAAVQRLQHRFLREPRSAEVAQELGIEIDEYHRTVAPQFVSLESMVEQSGFERGSHRKHVVRLGNDYYG